MIKTTGEVRYILQKTFDNGRFIGRTSEGGKTTVNLKDGDVERGWDVDAVVLGDKHGNSICGPIDMWVGLAIAQSVIEGDPIETTDPLTLYRIAACFLCLAEDIAGFRAPPAATVALSPDQLS